MSTHPDETAQPSEQPFDQGPSGTPSPSPYEILGQEALLGSAPPAPVRSRLLRRSLVGVLVLLLGALLVSWFLYLSPSHVSSPFFDRHGLPADIPLPDHSTFKSVENKSLGDTASNYTEWNWQVSGQDFSSVLQFYEHNLSRSVWTYVGPEQTLNFLMACHPGEVLVISAFAPSGDPNDTDLSLSVSYGEFTNPDACSG